LMVRLILKRCVSGCPPLPDEKQKQDRSDRYSFDPGFGDRNGLHRRICLCLDQKSQSSDNSEQTWNEKTPRERDRESVAYRRSHCARERENVALTESLGEQTNCESKKRSAAGARQRRQGIGGARPRAASARENDVAARNSRAARERENAAKALEVKKITDAGQKELSRALEESEDKVEGAAPLSSPQLARMICGPANIAACAASAKMLHARRRPRKSPIARQRELKQALDEK